MSNAHRLTVAFSLAAMFAAVSWAAMAQQPPNPNQPPAKKPPQGQAAHPPGPPGAHPGGPPGAHPGGPPGAPHPGGPAAATQFRGPAGPGGPGQFHGPARVAHIGERGYSFRGGFVGRREIVGFSPRERAIWIGGRWHHERRFGRLGYWWEVNGMWYFYDQPMEGPPAYVSEVEFGDDGIDPDAPVVVGAPPIAVVAPAPAVVVAPPAVVVAPAPIVVVPRPYVPPPVVCVGPLCIR